MLQINVNAWSCLELRKKNQYFAIQRNTLSSSSSIEGAVVFKLFYITRRLFQHKVSFLGMLSLSSHPEQKHTNTGIHTDLCSSCNTHQQRFESVVRWSLSPVTESVSSVYISSKQNLHLCCEPSFHLLHTVLWMKFFAHLRVLNLDPSFHVFWLWFLIQLISSKRACDVYRISVAAACH